MHEAGVLDGRELERAGGGRELFGRGGAERQCAGDGKDETEHSGDMLTQGAGDGGRGPGAGEALA